MIHGIYVRNRPKKKWILYSVVQSGELALRDQEDALNKAKEEGNDDAEVAIQTFETSFFIPQYLLEIKKATVLYN
jgi:hypothetical protein